MEAGRRRNVVLLGATGSIGRNTLAVIRRHPDKLRLFGVACQKSEAALGEIVKEFQVPHAAIFARTGLGGLMRMVTHPEVDIVLVAMSGTQGLRPTLAAIQAGKTICLASKEILVVAGQWVMAAARQHGVRILPVDSEHNAIFQCLEGHRGPVAKLILTASGGPFRDWTRPQMATVTPEQALQHPNWDMGPKITIDSSTMANKGLEMMEARWLFDVPPERIEVTIHRQSIVHSMVQHVDGSILAQLSPPSMTFAIQHALLYPERAQGVEKALDFRESLNLTFEPPDESRFPCLRLAREAMIAGGDAPCRFNAANEIAVAAFLRHEISYPAIAEVIEATLEQGHEAHPPSLEALLEAEKLAASQARQYVQRLNSAGYLRKPLS